MYSICLRDNIQELDNLVLSEVCRRQINMFFLAPV